MRKDAQVADARTRPRRRPSGRPRPSSPTTTGTSPADRKRAEGYLTASYSKEYLKTFTRLEKQKDGSPGLAVQTKTVVTATVLGSGVVDAEDDAAHVLVYVNQLQARPSGEPQIFQNRVS